jgi:phospholipase/lecithinase/hemolysin
MKCFSLGLLVVMALQAASFAQPAITKQPSNQTASLFADATFNLLVGGDLPLSYQWRFNNADLIGMTDRNLSITNIQRANAGNYSVVVSNPSGTVISQVAALTITPFNSIYAFGYSWTDTQGAEHGCSGPTTCPVCYWQGRYSNGPMWPEYVSTNLGLTYIAANNYAHCGAGASQVRDQVISFPVPPKPQLSLYFFMFSDDILQGIPGFPPYVDVTNTVAWNQVIQSGVLNNSNAVQRLYAKGARTIVIQSEIDIGKAPAVLSQLGNDTLRLSKVSEYCTRYNLGFFDAVTAYAKTRTDLRIVWVDLFSKINDVVANPPQYGFTKTIVDALDDPALTDKSLTGPGADYVFWNPLHATSKLHKLIAAWNLEALTNSILENLEGTIANGSPSIQMNHLQIGRDYTLQKSTNLNSWIAVQSFTAAAGTNQWSGTLDDSAASYFRLQWER